MARAAGSSAGCAACPGLPSAGEAGCGWAAEPSSSLFERGQLRAEDLGLTLAEAKGLLRSLQQAVVTEQTAEFAEQQTRCPCCGTRRPRKGQHDIVFRPRSGN